MVIHDLCFTVSLGATLIMKFQYHLINTLNQAECVLRSCRLAQRGKKNAERSNVLHLMFMMMAEN